ncbi:MAG: glycosyltransferase [Deltaproteobacteria bacterium]|nr:glycosyltransferase [Deltaproteobacteria bacterium]
MSEKRVLVLSFSHLDRDPRVHRQLSWLSGKYRVTAAGFSPPTVKGVDFIRLPNLARSRAGRVLSAVKLKARMYESFYWTHPLVMAALEDLEGLPADLVIGNDAWMLPIAARLAKTGGAAFFYDAHEFSPREYDDKFSFRFFWAGFWDYICRAYLPRAQAMTTVCRGLAKEYEKNYGVKCGIITNAPFFADLSPSKPVDGRVRMVHHGSADKERRLHNMISLIGLLDERFSLDFFLVGMESDYGAELRKMARNNPRISFLPPVPLEKIVSTINPYDVGLYLLYPAGFNAKMALPNKVFEFIQARLALAVWPAPEMGGLVEEHRNGVVSGDFSVESMATALNGLSAEDIATFKSRSHEAAPLVAGERNQELFLSTIRKLLG